MILFKEDSKRKILAGEKWQTRKLWARSRAREFEVVTHFQFLMKSGEQRSSHENLLLLERVSP